ncbi:MAG: hypothetical protein HYX38_33075 [Rhodospirillales bacterium]|nr:hypothetical protein [Rhodospirillales bacterium]
MDRAMVASLVATILAVVALGITTWLSFRFSGAVRAHEYAAIHRYKVEMGKHAADLEQEVSQARERALELEQAVSVADARAAEAARDRAAAAEKARSAEVDADEVRKRVAELGKQVREAAARAPAPAPAPVIVAEPPPPPVTREELASGNAAASPATAPSPIVASLKKYAGTKAAVYVLDEASDAPAVGATISGYLSDAGWEPLTWTWTGVGGIVGVVVLIKDGSDPLTDEAASAVLETLRSAGFNAAKGNWPADWRRFRGTLNGPQTPGPTEAPIRIVIGSKARGPEDMISSASGRPFHE